MAPWLEALWAIAKMFGMVFGMIAVCALVLVIFVDVWAKKVTVGKFFCYFIQQRHFFGRLLKEEGAHVYLGKGENREQYLLNYTKQFWTWWPAGLPQALQVPVRSHLFVRFNPEPFDPENLEALVSAKSLRIISDEAMLKTAWRDVRESMGMRGGAAAGLPMWAMIAIFASAALSGVALYLIMGLQGSIATVLQKLG